METETSSGTSGTAESSGGAAETSGGAPAGAGLAPAQTAESAGATSQTGAATAAPNFAEMHAAAERGEEIPLEHYDAYEKWLSEGMPEQTQPSEETPPQDTASEADKGGQAPAHVTEAMARVGAKTPEELPAKITELRNAYSQAAQAAKRVGEADSFLGRTNALLQGLAQGDPQAMADFEAVTGRKFPAGSTAPGGSQTEADSFLLPDELIDASLDPDLGKAFNDRLKMLRSDYEGKLRSMEEKLSGLDETKSFMEEQREQAARAKYNSLIVDNLATLAEKYGDDYKLTGLPVRTLIERYVKDPEHAPEELKELLETVNAYLSVEGATLEQAHKMRFYDRMNGKLAEARMGAAKPQQRTPSAGVAALGARSGQPAPAANLSDEQAEAMYSGAVPIPPEWLDEDGLPAKGRTPEKLYARLVNAA